MYGVKTEVSWLVSALAAGALMGPACGGQTAGPGVIDTTNATTGGATSTASTSNPSSGGTVSSAVVPNSSVSGAVSFAGTGPSTGGTSGLAGTGSAVGTQGGTATGGRSGTGGVISSGGTVSSGGGSTGGDWTRTTTDADGTVSSGDNYCIAPTAASDASYITGTNYAGYAFAFISLSEDLDDTIACSVGESDALCTAGQIVATENSPEGLSIVAAAGVNLNQSPEAGSPANPLPWQVTSVTVAFTNPGGSALRLQINQGTTYYCYDLSWVEAASTGDPITIAATDFNTECWTSSGTDWDGTGAIGIQLVVPSHCCDVVPFSICLNSVTIR